jgi:TatD DNase family protein
VIVDCHAHLTASAFDADRDDVLRRAREAGVVACLVVGEDPDDNERVGSLASLPSQGSEEPTGSAQSVVLPCYGFHPDRFADDRPLPERAEVERAKAAIRDRRDELAAIGEVGLDRYWVRGEERRRAQAALLEELAALALETDLALNVHSRSAGHYTLDLLRGVGVRRVLMHAFDGKASHAARAAEDGFVFSVPASVVRSTQKQKLIRKLPLDALALESDAPVLGPDRDARNEPSNIVYARDAIARAHGVRAAEVDEVTTANARRLFPALERV